MEQKVSIKAQNGITNIEIGGIHLPFVTRYSISYSRHYFRMAELELNMDIPIRKMPVGCDENIDNRQAEAYQLTDDGLPSLFFEGMQLDFSIKSYSVKRYGDLFEMSITLLIPRRLLSLQILT